MHGYCPSRFYGQLRKGALHLLGYFVGSFVYLIACVLPLFGLHLYHHTRIFGTYKEVLVVYLRHRAKHTIIESLVCRRVVLYEHNLRAFLKRKRLLCGEQHLGILARDGRLVCVWLSGQERKLAVVLLLRLEVVRGKPYVPLLYRRLEVGDITRVESGKHRVVGTVVAHPVKQLNKVRVALPVHRLKLNNGIACALKRKRRKEVWRVVIARQHLPLVVLSHRRKLPQVAYHHHLHTAKGQIVLAEAPQHIVHRIQEVGTHHGNLVDNECVDRLYHTYLLLGETVLLLLKLVLGIRDERCKRQLEERVYRNTLGIDSRNACWRHHHNTLGRLFL